LQQLLRYPHTKFLETFDSAIDTEVKIYLVRELRRAPKKSQNNFRRRSPPNSVAPEANKETSNKPGEQVREFSS
jgi:hypothetical protein